MIQIDFNVHIFMRRVFNVDILVHVVTTKMKNKKNIPGKMIQLKAKSTKMSMGASK